RIKRPSFPIQSPPQGCAIQISLFSPEISSPWRESLWLLRVWPLPSLSWPSLSAFVSLPSLFSPCPIAPLRRRCFSAWPRPRACFVFVAPPLPRRCLQTADRSSPPVLCASPATPQSACRGGRAQGEAIPPDHFSL